MSLSLQSRLAIGGVTIVLSIVSFVTYAMLATDGAKTAAGLVCRSVPVGSSAEVAVRAIASSKADTQMKFTSPDKLSVGFRGAFIDQWFCILTIVENKVIRNEVISR